MKEGIFKWGDLVVVVCKEPIKQDGSMGYHLSISHANRLPTYEELKEARYKFLPDDLYMAQIFPPKKDFVNLHQFCLHLYEI